MVVSEPLNEEGGQDWREVAQGQTLIVEQRGKVEMAPFVAEA